MWSLCLDPRKSMFAFPEWEACVNFWKSLCLFRKRWYILWTKSRSVDSERAYAKFGKLMHPLSDRSSLCVDSLSQNHDCETILWLLNQFGKACVYFPVGCCGHIVLDYVWLVGQFVKHSLQVREVVEFVKTSCWTCEWLPLGERVCRGKEITPGRNLVAAIEPRDFRSGLFL